MWSKGRHAHQVAPGFLLVQAHSSLTLQVAVVAVGENGPRRAAERACLNNPAAAEHFSTSDWSIEVDLAFGRSPLRQCHLAL